MWWVFAVGLIISGNVLAWFLGISAYLDKRVERYERELINRHCAEVNSMYRQMRGWRHDYHNHIQALKVCLAQKEYVQMEEYLNQMDSSLYTVDRTIKTGNLMLDAILNSKIVLIKEKQIAVDCTVNVPQQLPVKGIDLCVLLGNLLDNAMEACEQMEEGGRKFIRIYMDVMKGQFYVCITNSMKGRARKRGDVYFSAKEEGHGLGLGRIDRIVKQYGGFINRQSEESVFSTEVMLPLS